MWGIEHTAMAISAACFALWFTWKANWSWLGAAMLSQVPFWMAVAAYFISGEKTPTDMNMCLNLIAASLFVIWGKQLQRAGRGGVVHIWLCIIFLVGASIDVAHLLHEFDGYILAQEVTHYLALLTIGGRAHVIGLDGNRRCGGHRGDAGKSGGLV